MVGQIDEVLKDLGTGTWNIFHFFACAYSNILIPPHVLGRPFLAPKLNFTCQYYDDEQYSQDFYSNFSISPHNLTMDECGVMNEDEGELLITCTKYNFDNTTFTNTITSEFELVCGREHLRTSYQSLYQLGALIGSPLAGFVSDKFGRGRAIRISSIFFIIMALGTPWLYNFTVMLIARFIMGICHAVILNATYILAVEVCEPRVRPALGMSIYLVWAAAIMLWGGLAYLLRGWRVLQFVGSIPGLLFLPMLWMLDESPRWLVVKGRHTDAMNVLRKAAKWNKVELPPQHQLCQLLSQEATKTSYSSQRSLKDVLLHYLNDILVLFKNRVLCRITLCMYIIYCMASMVYYGLSLAGVTLSNNPFIYMVLSGIMEIPGYTLTIPIVQKFGRRVPTIICFMFCGIALFLLAVIPKDYNWAIMTLAMLGKMANSAGFQIAYFYSNELFPTEVRSRGVGTASTFSRIGSILAPIILDFVGTTYGWAPYVVFGAVSIAASCAAMLLPETRGVPLPDTVEQLSHRRSHRTSTSDPNMQL